MFGLFAERVIQLFGAVLFDQGHAGLGDIVLGQKGVLDRGQDVDNSVADANHVETGGAHGSKLQKDCEFRKCE